MLDGTAQRGAHQLGAGGEHDVGALGNCLLDKGIGVLAGNGVEVRRRFDLAGKNRIQLGAPEFVLAGPSADFRRALVDKGNLQVVGSRRADARQQAA